MRQESFGKYQSVHFGKRRNFRKSISMGFIEFVRPVDKKNSMGFTTSGILQNDVISL